MRDNDILSLIEEAERETRRMQTSMRASQASGAVASTAAQPQKQVAPAMAAQASAAQADYQPNVAPVQQPAEAVPAASAEQAKQVAPQVPQPQQVQSAPPMAPDAMPAPETVQTRPAEAAQAAAAAAIGQIEPARQPVAAEAVPAANGGMAGEPTGANTSSWHNDVPVGYGSVVRKGSIWVFGFLCAFLVWAVVFPIDSAVVSIGQVVSSGKNKQIQHLRGGVIKEILVKDGQRVEAGDLVLLLDSSEAQAELTRLLARQSLLEAQKTRYESEQSGTSVGFNKNADGLRGATDAVSGVEGSAVLSEQLREFDAGRKRLSAQLEAIDFQVETLKDQKAGLGARIVGAQKLLDINSVEVAKVKPLVRDGILPKARLWDLEKAGLEQSTTIENLNAEIAAIDQRVSEALANRAQLVEGDKEQNAEELTRVLGEMEEIRDSIEAAKLAVQLTEMRAPVSGTIVNMSANTKGGVVGSGDSVAEIVPVGAGLEMEFRIPPHQSKYVYPGQEVRVTITTFNRRTYDQIEGKVSFVSADSLLDENTGETYFLARATMEDNPEKNTGLNEITPGMSAEVYVLAEPRVFADYALQPITDSFSKAFREFN